MTKFANSNRTIISNKYDTFKFYNQVNIKMCRHLRVYEFIFCQARTRGHFCICCHRVADEFDAVRLTVGNYMVSGHQMHAVDH